jgi:beta-mannosidase
MINLGGEEWQLGQTPRAETSPGPASWSELAEVREWFPARVPGNVRADLVQAGKLPDLAFGTAAEASRWVDEHCWWLTRDFSLDIDPAERIHLLLRGVDYVSDIFLNGRLLGRHEGMFAPQIYDITALAGSQNRLAVRLLGSLWLPSDRSSRWAKLLNHLETRFVNLAPRFPHRRDTLKCQMGFGWDFSPAMPTMGIWDDVYLLRSEQVFIREVRTRCSILPAEALLDVEIDLDAAQAQTVRLRWILSGGTFEEEPFATEAVCTLPAGASRQSTRLSIPQPRLWWPWDHGHPDLYSLSVEVWADDRLSDSHTQSVGLRHVTWDASNLQINGRRIYVRGANWVPADILPGRVGQADYRALLDLARQANMNMLRVWGGGLREKHAFYDLCDHMGILIWQEFPFACAFLSHFPRSLNYLRLVDKEVRAIVRDLRGHPSVVLWCGGNEFEPAWNAPLVDTLRRAVGEEDPTRTFHPASPVEGDSHYWQVWHHFRPPSAYQEDQALFASEFGLQAPPQVNTLRGFLPADELWPPGPSWAYHGANLAKLRRYARPFLREGDESLEGFVQASQRAQAHGLRVAIEHYRRRKAGGCGGVLVWQFNEPWPAISWSLVDHERQPKPAYTQVQRLYEPLLVSIEYPLRHYQAGDILSGQVWILNDSAVSLAGCHLEVTLYDAAGQPVARFERTLEVSANSASVVGKLAWPLPEGDGWRLTCRLMRTGQTLAENDYDLSIHDGIQPTWNQRLWRWVAGHFVPS